MVKKYIIFIAIVSLSLLLSFIFVEAQVDTFKKGQVTFPAQGFNVEVEIAETETQRQQGLMHRKSLGLNKGMLFIFDQQRMQRVWMKNTLIPLDVVFLSDKKVVVSIMKDLKPCEQAPCIAYESEGEVKYMLELNAGVVERAAVKAGQKIIFIRIGDDNTFLE